MPMRPSILRHSTGRTTVSCFVIVAFASYMVLSIYTPVRDDEPIFADPGRSFATDGSFAAPILQGLVPGAGTRLMWQPPGFYFLTGALYKAFGFGLWPGRLLVALASALALGVMICVARRTSNLVVCVLSACVVGLSPWFVAASTTIRPDSLLLLFLSIALLFLLRFNDHESSKFILAAGCSAAAAMLLHPLGLTALVCGLAYFTLTKRFASGLLYAVVCLGISGSVCLVYVGNDLQILIEQLALQAQRKNHLPLFSIFMSQSRVLAYIPVLVGLAYGVVHYRFWSRRLEALFLLVTAVAAFVGREEQYPAAIALFSLPLLASALTAALRKRQAVKFLVALLIVMGFIPTLYIQVLFLQRLNQEANVTVATPDDVSVFLGTGTGKLYFEREAKCIHVFSSVPVPPQSTTLRAQASGLIATDSLRESDSEIRRLIANGTTIYRSGSFGLWIPPAGRLITC